MRAITFTIFVLLLAACQKPTYTGIPEIPDLTRYDSNTRPLFMYSGPQDIAKTDTAFYFQGHAYTITEKHRVDGITRHIDCSGPYRYNRDLLTVDWTTGSLAGTRETLRPVMVVMDFTKLKSEYREFWVKTDR